MAKRRPRTYHDIIGRRVEKFDREEDGSVGFPNGKVVDAETKRVRNPIPFKRRRTR